jgi:glc operon protein GlcG
MKKLLLAVSALLLSASALVAHAQLYGAPITLEQAKKAMAAAQAEARKNKWNFSIAIVDNGGHMVLFERSDGAFFASASVARDKAWSAAAYRRPGKAFQDRIAKGAEEIRILRLRGASPIDGGEPLVVEGKVVGAIGVSGGAGEQDGQVAKAGVAALK